ncbi:hypothetical protein A9Q96_10990 [Rhodobacterales bacterium 52_120_T64]|nr:hypothetical protein A9Q96_10990 [Rhodobacterales bacterium 52_120_T64]
MPSGMAKNCLHAISTATFPNKDEDYAVKVGLRMLTLRHMVMGVDGKFSLTPKLAHIVQYYANAIAHHVESD